MKPIRIAGCLVSLLFVLPAAGQDRVDTLRQQFVREPDPVRHAKLFPKLGEALLARARSDEDAGQPGHALAALREYRDDLHKSFESLKAAGRNAEKHPAGFRELQIHTRKSLQQINQVVLGAPFDQREPFVVLQHAIEQIDQQLIQMLFPPPPEQRGKPKS